MTDRRSETSAINGAKSRGPVSADGKAKSSRNAVKFGIFSKDLLLPGESQEDFDALLNALLDEHKPAGHLEAGMIERLAVTMWRQQRLLKAERATILLQQRSELASKMVNDALIEKIRPSALTDTIAELTGGGDKASLIRDAQIFNMHTETLSRYQAVLDNEIIKLTKALRDQQQFRRQHQTIDVDTATN
jgi:hypothetical protein